MSSVRFLRRTLRRGVLAAVTSFALFGMCLPASATTTGQSAVTIDTYSTWDGGSSIAEWGNPDTATYGQVITVPSGKKQVKWFTYYMSAFRGTGTVVFRGEIYGWDGSKATKAVWESKPRTLDPSAAYVPVKFKAKNAKVKAGRQYVLFASVSKDYEETAPNVTTQWACHTSDVLAGGYLVFLNDTGDESQWTTTAWSVIDSYDMAFMAKLA